MTERKWRCGIVCLLLLTILTSCVRQGENKELTVTGFAFDTVYTLTFYQGGSQELLNSCVEKCSGYEKVFSRTLEESELHQLNEIEELYQRALEEDVSLQVWWEAKDSVPEELKDYLEHEKSEKNTISYTLGLDGSISFEVSDMLRDILQKGLEYSIASGGSFDISVEPVTSLWDFKAESPVVPEEQELALAVKQVDYRKLSLEGNLFTMAEPGMGIDLGGIAKGFIADDLNAYLRENGVTGAMINLGGNVLCLGEKEGGEPFRIGVQQPFADRNQTVAAVEVRDMSVVSSGIYERYFETEDDVLYHHIIDPKTGYSYENDLLGVTILSEKSVDGDALSTTCFALGREKGMEYVDSLEGVYALFITKDEKLWYSEGFETFLLEEK